MPAVVELGHEHSNNFKATIIIIVCEYFVILVTGKRM